jgi:hypothetical protein
MRPSDGACRATSLRPVCHWCATTGPAEPGPELRENRAFRSLERCTPKSPLPDSNRRPLPYHGSALPTELRGRAPPKTRQARGSLARDQVLPRSASDVFAEAFLPVPGS